MTTGCLEQEEDITVKKDGKVAVTLLIKGDPNDLAKGRLGLPPSEHYQVSQELVTVKSGQQEKQEARLKATGEFASVADMPNSRVSKDSKKWASEDFQWSQKLDIRQDEKRTLYVFTRAYKARPWARYRVHYKRHVTKEIEGLLKNWAQRSQAERRKVVTAFLKYEQGKYSEWLELALARALPKHGRADEAQVRALDSFKETMAKTLSADHALSLLKLPAKQLETRLAERQSILRQSLLGSVCDFLALNKNDELRLADAFDRARYGFEVSEDLSDENFRVAVTMPGKIVSSNGQVDGQRVRWSFHGKDCFDRRQKLIVISAVENH